MSQPTLFPSPENIVINFNAWLKSNHAELLKDTPAHLLSTIENKWNGLLSEYITSQITNLKSDLENHKSHVYPEGKE